MMAEDQRQLTDEEQQELLGYLVDVRDRHIRRERGIWWPRFTTIVLDTDVSIPAYGVTVHAGAYHMRMPEGTMPDCLTEEHEYLWTESVDAETLRQMIADTIEGKAPAKRKDGDGEPRKISVKMNLNRVDLKEGRPLHFEELLAWIAIAEAEEAGDKDRARRVFELVYKGSVPDGKADRYKELPRQDVRKLHRQNDPISKVVHVMTNPALFGEEGAKVDVASEYEKSRGKEIRTAVTFSWDGEGVKIYRPISQYDREIHGAVSSLWADGQRVVTAAQVAKAMGIRNPTRAQTKKAAESVDLQRRVLGKIDYTEEARGRSLTFEGEPVSTFKLEGNLIAADKTEIETANGKVVEGYILHRAPIMYQHAATLGQVVNYPQRLLGLGDGRDTEQNIILRRELLRRVYRIKSNYKKARTDKKRQEVNRNIRFTTDSKHPERCLFEAANVNQKDRHARKKALDYVIGILDGLAEDGEIADYKPTTETGRGGTRTVGAEIIL